MLYGDLVPRLTPFPKSRKALSLGLSRNVGGLSLRGVWDFSGTVSERGSVELPDE
jgi:hypothetical protein